MGGLHAITDVCASGTVSVGKIRLQSDPVGARQKESLDELFSENITAKIIRTAQKHLLHNVSYNMEKPEYESYCRTVEPAFTISTHCPSDWARCRSIRLEGD
jgi:hypothetical protein